MGTIGWFARNGVAANLLMMLIIVGGLIMLNPWGLLPLKPIKQEVFPEFSLDRITVTVPYLGAAPEEVEEAVCVRIEEAIQDLDGIKKLTSTASEGVGTVMIELELGADARTVLDDVKSRVDAISTFPEETEQPIIAELTNRRQAIFVAVSGPVDEKTLRRVAERVRDEITAQPGITLAELANARPYEISIEVEEQALRRHGLTFDAVARAVRRSSLDLPGGSLKTAAGEILLRTKGQAYVGDEFERLVLLTRTDGTHLTLGEVAHVVDGFADTDQASRFDGQPAVLIEIFRTGEQDVLQIVNAVRDYVATARARLPAGIELTTWNDSAKVLESRRNLLIKNGAGGLALVVLMLALFLRFRLAGWVALGMLISFLGVFLLMPWLDVSISLISLFAFILVLGIVVDDAIVVGENIYTHQHTHGDGLRGSIEGAMEVGRPVVFAVLTTVAAFLPMTAVEGATGKVMKVIPLIVIPCLLWSLVESLWILPYHLSHYRKKPPGEERRGWWRRLQGAFADGLTHVARRIYGPSLELALRWRYLTLAVGIGTLLLTAGLVLGGWIGFVFFPSVEADFVSAAVTLPLGSPASVTEEAVLRLELAAKRLRTELREGSGEDPFLHMQSAIGEHPFRRAQSQNAGGITERVLSSHLGEVTIELAPAEARSVSSEEISKRWRELTGAIPDALELSFSATLFSAGEDVNVQLTGLDIDELRRAADEVKSSLATYDGVYEVSDSFLPGKREIKLAIRPGAEVLGLTLEDLARQVRQAFYGEEVQRIQRGRDEVKVMVRYPEAGRRSLGDLEQMRIRTSEGREVPFSEVAAVTSSRGYSSIKRVNRQRAINVTASVDAARVKPSEVNDDLAAKILPGILARHPGVHYSYKGTQAEQRDTLGGLVRGFLFALIAIYALLAVPLRSYLQPLMIMSAIPFGLVGAVAGHMILGLDLTILSMFGLVALTGVVVNDSLVMVDFINRFRERGGSLFDAVRQAGVARFRPIILTSATTFAGLMPLMLERSMQARFLIPMAVSLAFGVVFATFITLGLIPASYIVAEDLKRVAARWLLGRSDRGATDSHNTPGPSGVAIATDR